MIVAHSVDDALDELLEATATGQQFVAGLGPIYRQDPAASVLEPFRRSAEASGWSAIGEQGLAPDWALKRARGLRSDACSRWLDKSSADDRLTAVEWTRAGLVLGVASRRGFKFGGRQIHPRWDLNATITTRFGSSTEELPFSPWRICPLRIAAEHRRMVRPSSPGRHIAVMDFRAMDLCSMLSLPNAGALRARYDGSSDYHFRTAQLLWGRDDVAAAERELAKEQLFVYAYGGRSELHDVFEARIPELKLIRALNDNEPGEAARVVQRRSAETFRTALSAALLLLTSDAVAPMFVVHDELVIDVDSGHAALLEASGVAAAMESSATRATGVGHAVDISVGDDYGSAKR